MTAWPARFGNLVYDDVLGRVTVELIADDAPPVPNDGNLWSSPVGSVLTFDVPVRKRSVSAPTATKIETSPTGFRYTRYTWNGSEWANPQPVDEAGNPI